MAASYTCSAQSVTWAASKNMIALFNASGSGVIVRVYRIWLTTPQTSAVSGGLGKVNIGRFTTVGTGGTSVSFLKHDTNSGAVPAQVTCVHGPTVITITNLFRQVFFPTDEIAVSGATWEEMMTFLPLGLIWDAGYYDATIEPITLREGEGVVLQTTASSSAVGAVDINLEMTIT